MIAGTLRAAGLGLGGTLALGVAALTIPNVPGATNARVTQANIASTICKAGWTATIRPPASYTDQLKREQMARLKLPGTPRDYEEDHLVSLEIGGNPTDPANLWPEPWHGQWNAHQKDRLENALHKDVCAGRMTLIEAQRRIATDWRREYQARWGVPGS